MNEFASLLYNKINTLDQEGIKTRVPYAEKLQAIFQDSEHTENSDVEVELLMSSLYFFYANRVFKGLDEQQTAELGWYLPRKKQSYVNRLDSLLQDPNLINKPIKDLPSQYYRLKDALQQYRNLKKKEAGIQLFIPKN